jgi:AraC-like DNA-binding protein
MKFPAENRSSLHRLAGRLPMATSHAGVPGEVHEMSTDGVPPDDRFAFMQRMNLDRMSMSRPAGATGIFEMRMRRIFGRDTHVMETSGEAIRAERTREHALRDGVDYVSLNLITHGCGFHVEHLGHTHRLEAGMWYFVDSAEPIVFDVQQHVMLSLFMPRYRMVDAIGRIPDRVPDALGNGAVGAVLAAQFRTLGQEAVRMTAAQRIVLVGATTDLALAALQAAVGSEAREMSAYEDIYLGACRYIGQHCADAQLEPGVIAQALDCSRATLYRAFAAHGEGVAQRIREARLTLARNMIESRRFTELTLGDIAFRSGFLDQSAFNRMFRRRHGMTPGEARARLAR